MRAKCNLETDLVEINKYYLYNSVFYTLVSKLITQNWPQRAQNKRKKDLWVNISNSTDTRKLFRVH